jgi:hypothetical protein
LIAVSTLLASCSQIARDLNKKNEKSLSFALTDILNEAPFENPANSFWRTFNNNTANFLKHAKNNDKLELEITRESVLGAFAICICELNSLEELTPTSYAFAEYQFGNGHFRKLRFKIEILRINFWVRTTSILIKLHQNLFGR